MEEVAQTLGVSLRTVHSDWAFARAWLYRSLTGGAKGDERGTLPSPRSDIWRGAYSARRSTEPPSWGTLECGADVALRTEVQSLVDRRSDASDDFMARPAIERLSEGDRGRRVENPGRAITSARKLFSRWARAARAKSGARETNNSAGTSRSRSCSRVSPGDTDRLRRFADEARTWPARSTTRTFLPSTTSVSFAGPAVPRVRMPRRRKPAQPRREGGPLPVKKKSNCSAKTSSCRSGRARHRASRSETRQPLSHVRRRRQDFGLRHRKAAGIGRSDVGAGAERKRSPA